MFKSCVSTAVLFVVLLGIGSIHINETSAESVFANGEGTEEFPYLVETADHLNNIRGDYLGCHFSQVADIDLGQAPWNEGEGWLPVGSSGLNQAFTGSFDGAGHMIANLTISRPGDNNQGLFGYLHHAEVNNINLVDASIKGGSTTGILAGRADNSSIKNVHVSGNVNGGAITGGLVGYTQGFNTTFQDVSAHAKVIGDIRTGGLIGHANMGPSIHRAHSLGTVQGEDNTGGLIGMAANSIVITESYSQASVSGGAQVGGLVGLLDSDSAVVSHCYSAGFVEGTGSNVGGLIGSSKDGASFQYCYWDTDNSTQESSAGGIGRTRTEMKVRSTYENWDFVNTWWIAEREGYPVHLTSPQVISFSVNPVGGGNVQGAGIYQSGYEVALVASAEEGFAFINWTENEVPVSDQETYSFIASEDRHLVANFNEVPPVEYLLSLNKTGMGAIKVKGVKKELPFSNRYLEYAEVTLTAIANENWQFMEWKGDLSGTDATSTIFMDTGKSITAVFERKVLSRLAGSNGSATTLEISKDGWDSANTVVLARGDDYADALAGVPLAYQLDAPILLTPTGSLDSATEDEVGRLGAGKVIILGGTAAISDDVKGQLEFKGLSVDRIAGGNRYETAAKVAERLAEEVDFNTAFIAVGTNFADALAASSYAAMRGEPILLVEKDRLPDATGDALVELGIENTYVCGGPAAVSDAVKQDLPNPTRISGANRYTTALALAEEFLPVGTTHVGIATGLNYPDAVAGGVWAAKNNTGILLVNGTASDPGEIVEKFLEDRGITAVTLFGGPAAVSSEMVGWFEDNLGE